MAQEYFPDAEQKLFGPGFKQRLKTRSETADTIEKAAKVSTPGRGKPFFRGMAFRGRQSSRGGHQLPNAKERRLSDQDRSQGCILDRSSLEGPSKLSTLSVEEHSARVCLPSIRASHCCQGFHQTYEACSSHAETKGSAPNYLFSLSSESTRKSGVCYQLQEVSADSKPANRVLRLSDRFSSFVTPTPRQKVVENKKTMPKITKFRRGLNTRIIKIPGPPNFFYSGSFPSPSSLSTALEVKKSQLEHPSVLRCNNSSGLPSEGGTGLVAIPPSRMEWKSTIPQFCPPSDRNRCIPQGLGGVLRKSKYRGPMVYRRTETSHKLSRTPCRVLCHQNFLRKQSGRTCQTVDGQCFSSGLHQQNGGTHSKTLAKLAIDLWNWCLDHKIHVSAEHLPGVLNLKADKESRVVTDPSDWKLKPAFFKILVQKWGPLEVDLFASRLTFQLAHFVSWKPDPQAIATYAFLMNWRDFRGYAFPPFALVGCCLQRVEHRPFSASCSCVASAALVPSSSTLSSGQASAICSRPRAFNERQPCTSFDQPSVGWMGTMSQHYKTSGISRETRDILLAAWQRNTSSAYSCVWNKWVSWCRQRQINPISVSLNSVLEFLKDQFKEGKAYRTLNVYRSALSAVLPEVDSWRVGAHPLVTQLLKRKSHFRPPAPKYSYTWNVSEVLSFIKSLGPNEKLNLKLLSLKLAMLLGFTAPDHSSDLVKRDLRYRMFHPGVSVV